MEVNCEGCAGCCIDWRPLGAPDDQPGRYQPLDDEYNLVPLTSDEVRAFCRSGAGGALVPRLFAPPEEWSDDRAVRVDGHRLAAIDGRPIFAVGLRSVPKPVGPFGTDRRWLSTCVFLDPETLQCRIHDDDRYPRACAAYPGHNLQLGAATECDRVERVHGGDRLADADPPAELPPRPFGPQALGATVFAHPEPDTLTGRVDRLVCGEPTDEDRATFVGCAAGSAPGSVAVDDERRATARRQVIAADGWIEAARDDWLAAADLGATADDPPAADRIETDRGAPPTPGWE